MIRHILALSAIAALLASCGVKTDLVTPNGKKTQDEQHNPSKPPHPLGR